MNAWRQLLPWVLRRRRNTVAVLATVTVALTASTFAGAASVAPAATTVMYACVNPTTKVLTQSTATATCPSGGTKIHWNQTGPPGLVWKGAWKSGTIYAPTNAVQYQGSAYITLVQTAVTPPAGPWQLLASIGARGLQGPAGLSVGYFGGNPSNVVLSGSDSSNPVLIVAAHTVSQSGTYFINASAVVGNNGGSGDSCAVGTDNGGPAADGIYGSGNGSTVFTVSVTDSITVLAGDAPALWCYQEISSDSSFVGHASLTAILMNSVNTSRHSTGATRNHASVRGEPPPQ